MTRKDYILIADGLRHAYATAPGLEIPVVSNVAYQVAIKLETDNPRFNREHFLAVVRGEKDLNSRPGRG